MRKLECRAKAKRNEGYYKQGDWIYGHVVYLRESDLYIIYCLKTGNPYIVVPETIDRLTTIKAECRWEDLSEEEQQRWIDAKRLPSDFCGRDVYENDVVRWYSEGVEDCDSGISIVTDCGCDLYLYDAIEILGNIHDNPELLREVEV